MAKLKARELKYSIDTNALINCWRRKYPRDVFPALWTKLEDLIRQEILFASEEVFHELEKVDNEDDLLIWAKTNRNMFIPMNEDIQLAVRLILQVYPGMINIKKNQSGADPFVIAVAKLSNGVVITDEHYSNNSDRPKIPDVCKGLGIRSLSVLEFIKEQGWTF